MHNDEIKKAAVFLLRQIDKTNKPANEIVNAYTRTHRYIGSNDRKQLLEYIWNAIRRKARLQFLYPEENWETLIEKTDAELVLPLNTPDWVRWEVPQWLLPHIPEPATELPALLDTPSVIIRANGDRMCIQSELQKEGIVTTLCKHSPLALQVEGRYNLVASKAYKNGLIEIQDEGAQLIGLEVGVTPKCSVFDFCAGAGGKSLLFAQVMQNRGEILAYDTSVRSLKELQKRAYRAKVSIIKTTYKHPQPYKKFDYVVVDAPCSGTGTWRRCPDARWNLTEKQLLNIVKRQKEILDIAKTYVKNGHFLAYMTCSITTDENEGQVDTFLSENPDFHLVKMRRVSPARTGTDGLFVALLQKQ